MRELPIKNSGNEAALIDFKFNLTTNKLLSDDYIENVIKFGSNVLNDLENFSSPKRNALIVGHVQSGKTINYISIIANAYQRNYDICFVLTSTITKLLKQTWKRINDSFNGINNQEGFEKYIIRQYGSNFTDNEDILNDINSFKQQMLVYTLMKNNLTNLYELFKKNPILKNKRILIIDDEGDVASWSLQMTEETKESSKTHEELLNILNLLTNRTFISITATPYVQLFVEQNELIFSKVYTLNPNEKYYGINEFIEPKNKLINIINNSNEQKQNASLENSYLFFIISHTYRLYDIYKSANFDDDKYFLETNNLFSEMIIHTSDETKDHEKICKYLKQIKKSIQTNLKKIILCFNDKLNIFDKMEPFLKKFFDEQLLPIIRNNFFDESHNEHIDNHYLYLLIKNIYNNTSDLVIHTINSKNEKKSNQFRPKRLTVYIGARMIERGITFENLLCSYFNNDSNNLDTFLQRNRWFGYRENIVKYMKLFINQQLYNNFINKAKSTNNIFNELERLHINNLSLNEFNKALIPNRSEFLITSKRNYSTNKFNNIFYSQNLNDIVSDQLGNIFLEYFNKHYHNQITYIKNYSFETIEFNNFQELIKKVLNDDYTLIQHYLKNKFTVFQNLVQKFQHSKVKLFYMKTQKGDVRYRESIDDKIYLFQGYNKNAIGEGYWNQLKEFSQCIIIQIYPIIIKNNNQNIVKLVFQFPNITN